MKILLDTHVWIWAANNDPRLPQKMLQKLSKCCMPEDLYLLDISIWEAGRVYRAGELTRGNATDWFREALGCVTTIPITASIAVCEQGLQWEHKDPADRLIVAASITLSLPLMTLDKRIVQWGQLQLA